MKIFIIAGQSNADGSTSGGAAGLSSNYASYAEAFSGARYAYQRVNPGIGTTINYGFGDLQPYIDPWSDSLGSEVSLGRELRDFYGEHIATMKYAAGGTGLRDNWLPEAEDLYSGMISYFSNGMDIIESVHGSVRVGGFFWHQGETDAGLYDSVGYGDDFTTFSNALRTDLSDPRCHPPPPAQELGPIKQSAFGAGAWAFRSLATGGLQTR